MLALVLKDRFFKKIPLDLASSPFVLNFKNTFSIFLTNRFTFRLILKSKNPTRSLEESLGRRNSKEYRLSEKDKALLRAWISWVSLSLF
ncbi:hypothetical protein HPHPP25_0497 [Helicobacter pylori Hp P-25]|nr:hypothetical protein HPHPP25_0497 [Helicobacter pylori Hp P-25]